MIPLPSFTVLQAGQVSSILVGIEMVLQWPTVFFLFAGLVVGMALGALPGIGAAIGIVILLPLSVALQPIDALVLFVSMYSGGMYGSSISAILMNIPGTVASAATLFDGYPMTRQGRAVTALTISAISSGVGGLVTVIALVVAIPFFIPIVLLFGSPEYALVAFFGIALISVVARGSISEGIVMGAFGLMLSTIGAAAVSPELRFTMGTINLYDGLSYVSALIGLFAIAEMFKLATESQPTLDDAELVSGSRLDGIRAVLRRPITLIKSATIGAAIGAIPGAGASVSNFVSYAEALRSADDPESFGDGDERGVIAAEAANNGTVGGSLVPTLSFGIPGSGTTAILLGAFLIHGLQPGPELFTSQLQLTYSLYVALLIGNILIIVLGTLFVTNLYHITKVDADYIVPVVVVLGTLGAFALRNNWVDVVTVYLLGVAGYYLLKHEFPIIPFVLGLVLGPIAEANLFRSLNISGGSAEIFIETPLRVVLVVGTVLTVLSPVIGPLVTRAGHRLRSGIDS